MAENFELIFAADYDKPNAPMHCHNGVELVMVERGSCTVEFQGFGCMNATAGQVFVTPPKIRHEQKGSDDCRTVFAVMNINGGNCDDMLRIVDTGKDPILLAWFNHLVFMQQQSRILAAPPLLEAIWKRLSEFENQTENMTWAIRHQQMEQVVAYMRNNFYKPLTIKELCLKYSISESYFNTLFQKTYAISPLQYLIHCRLQRARQLLQIPYWNISEVARNSGFQDQNYFSRVFRKYFAETPSQYRKRTLKDDWTIPPHQPEKATLSWEETNLASTGEFPLSAPADGRRKKKRTTGS